MRLLQQVSSVVSAWGPCEAAKRDACAALLSRAEENMAAALDIWREVHAQEPGDGNRFTVVLWFGAERAKALHRIHLDQVRIGASLTELTGVAFNDTMGVADDFDIVQAYGQLRRDETPTEHAEHAIDVLTRRIQQLSQTCASL